MINEAHDQHKRSTEIKFDQKKKKKMNTSTIKKNNSGTIRPKLERLITFKDLTTMRAFIRINK